MLVDEHVAVVALGLDEDEVEQPVEDKVVDLGDFVIHDKAQVVQQRGVGAVAEQAVEVKGGISLAMQAALLAGELFSQPVALSGVDAARPAATPAGAGV